MKPQFSLFIIIFFVVAFCAVEPTVLAATAKPKVSQPLAPNKVDALMKIYDLDHDGKLDKQEMKMFMAADPADAKAALAFDRDHDGVLSVEEVVAWRAASAVKMK